MIGRFYAKSSRTVWADPGLRGHQLRRHYHINDVQMTHWRKTKVLESELEQLFFSSEARRSLEMGGLVGQFSPRFQNRSGRVLN